MDSPEDDFFAKLMVTFREEAKEHIQALSEGLLELEKDLPSDQYKQVVETIFREAHSLKGASRSVNQQNIQEICQSLENVLAALKQGILPLTPDFFDAMHATVEALGEALQNKLESEKVSEIVTQLNAILEKKEAAPPKNFIKEFSPTSPLKIEEPPAPKTPPPANPEQKSSDKTIRVSLQKLNQLFQEVEETLTIKLLFNQQLTELKQLSSQLRLQEKQLNSLISTETVQRGGITQSRQITTKSTLKSLDRQQQELKASKEQLNRLIKSADQNAHYVSSLVDTLVENAKKILMQPTSTLFEAIPLMVREISRHLSKDVRVEITGGDIEIDRRILEEIKDPITHLIRNAIDHGIELPEERVKRNKPSYGTIKITCSESEGNNVNITLADDGGGINLEKLKQSAIRKGVLSEKEAQGLTQEQAIQLAFQSDISTSPIITELSGRGLGLGIVSEKVDKLGGHICIDTVLNQGTTFTLTLPLTLATFRGVHITVGEQDFIVPTHNVKKVMKVKITDIKRTENKETIHFDNQSFSFIHLANLLGLAGTHSGDSDKDYFFGLMIKAAEHTLVFGADYVHKECEILVKSLGSHCVRLKNVVASTIMEKGNIIPVLNPNDLVKSALREGGSVTRTSSQKKAQSVKKVILLAEDSITTRLLFKNILTSAAYEVITAVDGVEAFEKLQTQKFDLIMTDVEMPRMTGLELTEKVRAQEKFKDIPIIMCTALGSREDRERGIELGASAYLDKNNFNQQVLLNIVQKLI